MSERETLTLSLPVIVERRLGDRGIASGCGTRCPYRTHVLHAGFGGNPDKCNLFDEYLTNGDRTADCVAGGLACSDDPYTVRGK